MEPFYVFCVENYEQITAIIGYVLLFWLAVCVLDWLWQIMKGGRK